MHGKAFNVVLPSSCPSGDVQRGNGTRAALPFHVLCLSWPEEREPAPSGRTARYDSDLLFYGLNVLPATKVIYDGRFVRQIAASDSVPVKPKAVLKLLC